MNDEEHIKRWNDAMREAAKNYKPPEKLDGRGWMMVEDAEDESADAIAEHLEQTAKERAANAQAVIEAIREAKERRLAEERAKAAEPKPAPPSDGPWAVIGKAEDDGDRIMDITRNFG